MFGKFFAWMRRRWEASLAKSQRGVARGACGAHLMVMHLCGVRITSIDLTDPYRDDFYGTALPDDGDPVALLTEITRQGHRLLLARGAQTGIIEILDTLMHGRRLLDKRLPDKTLFGMCDGTGTMLDSDAAIIGHAITVAERIMADDTLTPEGKAFHMSTIGKQLAAHYCLAIVHLNASIKQTPVVAGEAACQALFTAALARAPANSMPLACACHTDPLKPAFDEFMAEQRARQSGG